MIRLLTNNYFLFRKLTKITQTIPTITNRLIKYQALLIIGKTVNMKVKINIPVIK